MTSQPRKGLELRSTITTAGELVLALAEVEIPVPVEDQVVIRIEAAPINPSDLALLLGTADLATLRVDGERTVASVPKETLRTLAARLDQALPVGNEGAGTVIDAGDQARALVGKRVATSGAMYAQWKLARARECLPLPDGTTAAQGASAFVNPMTALAMVEALRREGHKALVHTAAASNLGQMLVKICAADRVPLVNIVRSGEQVALLRGLGAEFVVDSSTPSFRTDLVEAIAATGATLAFDAIGGGRMGSHILTAMETVAARSLTAYNRYGSNVHKQLYIYGRLDPGPTQLDQTFGFAWDVAGFLVTSFLMKAAPEAIQRMRARVMAELTTTFASHYSATISLREALRLDVIRAYARRATGTKYLIDPVQSAL
jgi:NADPH:quinone reductase-like Zn-dependent oxidoreductase